MINKMWKTRDGTKIVISAMGNSHLINTIKMLEKYAQAKLNYYINLYASYDGNGEQARYMIDDMFDILLESSYEDFLPEVYYDLFDERERRQKC